LKLTSLDINNMCHTLSIDNLFEWYIDVSRGECQNDKMQLV